MSEPIQKLPDTLNIVQNVFDLKEIVVDKEIRELEERLNNKIDSLEERLNKKIEKAESDIHNRIDKFETNMFRFITIGLAVTAIAVRLLFLL